jgi:hypothetical protein
MNWSDVITHPLGLVAYALALVFGVVGVRIAARNKPWFFPVAIAMAALVIVGGLFLAYQDIKSKAISATLKSPVGMKEVKQETHGADSPAVQGVGGNLTIIHNQGGKGK